MGRKPSFNVVGGLGVHRAAISLPRLAIFDYYMVKRTLSGALLALVLRCNLLGDAELETSFDINC